MSSDVRNYHVLHQIGGGAFGTVYKARDRLRHDIVALKKVFCAWTREEGQHYQQHHVNPTPNLGGSGNRRSIPPRVMREIIALKYLRMENVVQLLEMFPNGSHVILVFEYMPTNLRQILSHYRLSCSQQKKYAQMLMVGLDYIHGVRIIHRDLKPENLLIAVNGVLKVADFGLCRLMSTDSTVRYENQAGTRHYRAPEVIFGSQTYSDRADIWSAGCVMYEMACNKPFLWADDDIDIAVEMLRTFGLPNLTMPAERHFDDLKEHFPDLFKVTFELPNSPTKPLYATLSQKCDDVYVADLIAQCLTFFPWQRSSAKQVLRAEAFTTAPLPAALQDLPDIGMLRHGRRRVNATEFEQRISVKDHVGPQMSKQTSSQKISVEPAALREQFTNASTNFQPTKTADRSLVQKSHKPESAAVTGRKSLVSTSPAKLKPVFGTITTTTSVVGPSYAVSDNVNRRLASASVKNKILPDYASSPPYNKFVYATSIDNISGQVNSHNKHRPERKSAKKGNRAWY